MNSETQQRRTIRLRSAGHVGEYLPAGGEEFTVSLAGPRTMREILADLGVPHGLVMGVIVQGRRYGLDYVPADGDEVTLISPPAGG